MIGRIVSGGQTGVDRWALEAAEACGVPTGGVMPRGFLAADGPHPEFAARFGMTEHASEKYPPRTRANVARSDATLILCHDVASRGTALTVSLCGELGRPLYVVDLSGMLGGRPGAAAPYGTVPEAVGFLAQVWRDAGYVASALNVAGNRADGAPPWFERTARAYLAALIDLARTAAMVEAAVRRARSAR